MGGAVIRRWSLVALGVGVAACAAGGGHEAPGTASPRDREVITRAELETSQDRSLFEAVRRLRPAWLRHRGQSVIVRPERERLRIYLDGTPYGDVEALRSLDVTEVEEVRFLDAQEATTRFGTGHPAGAILVSTRREERPPT